MTSNRTLAAVLTLIAAISIAGCGGGGASSGSSSSGFSKSASIVIQLPGGVAMQRQLSGPEAVSLAIVDLLIDKAWADVFDVYLDGSAVPLMTDADGYLAVAVDPGVHTVCVVPNGTDISVLDFVTTPNAYCISVDVAQGDVVVVDITSFDELNGCDPNIDGAGCYVDGSVTNINELDLAQNLDKPNQTYICHKPGTRAQKTLSVGTPAVGYNVDPAAIFHGHMAHGDTLGPCDDPVPVLADGEQALDGENFNGNNGNNGNKVNNGNNGNKGNNGNRGNSGKKGNPNS